MRFLFKHPSDFSVYKELQNNLLIKDASQNVQFELEIVEKRNDLRSPYSITLEVNKNGAKVEQLRFNGVIRNKYIFPSSLWRGPGSEAKGDTVILRATKDNFYYFVIIPTTETPDQILSTFKFLD